MNAPLPKAIQKAVEAATAAQSAITSTVTPAAALQAADPAVAVVQSATPVANEPSSATPPANADQIAALEQKMRSMQGRYQAELANSQTANAQLQSQVAQMQQQIDALAAAAKAIERSQPAADPKDVENFGADMIEMVQRYADKLVQNAFSQVDSVLQAVNSRLNNLEASVNGVTQRTETTLEQQFYAALASAVPDWEQINADSRWLEWLGATDPVYGIARQAGLDDARKKLDVQRVVNIFNEFKRQLPPAPQRPSLADQVAPNTVASVMPSAPAAAPFITSAYVQKFYNDKAKGRIPADEAARIEAEINTAAREGRIR